MMVKCSQKPLHSHNLYFNFRQLFKVIDTKSDSPSPEAIISLNAEKAFDRGEWDYFFYTLNKHGFGPIFIKLIKFISTDPTASVFYEFCFL